MTSSRTEHPANTSAQDPRPCQPRKGLQFAAEWWPALLTGAAATALASFLYVASALAFTKSQPGYGIGFAAFGLFINALPTVIVWAATKWTR